MSMFVPHIALIECSPDRRISVGRGAFCGTFFLRAGFVVVAVCFHFFYML